ncbi:MULTISPECIES: Hsp20/alpha crystallin family protein [Nguyenibacter]|uniref:Hsp20/alpha crystallin family protein n=1 Tax=Nguyenibacter vanlangensis TaxID=1216886 RepID=A0A7Y7ITI4_9PROT|nr:MULTISPECIES: Hsp20/alpha crystallin family protein [Nguyenibacter]NVN10025.1 Hsp20/alpha crystallin family protein [Nguyenibacter vanlangensis]WRH88986.1 Hsp20/alpha crystallin family protein [Nguyenibacter sp. L1]
MADPNKLAIKPESRPAKPLRTASWPALDTLRRELDRRFDELPSGWWRRPFGRSSGLDMFWPRGEGLDIAPPIDILDRDNRYEITVELPGMDETDVEVKTTNDTLIIRGEKHEEKEEKKNNYYHSERRFGTFLRSFQIPDEVDVGAIEASFSKGVLTVTLPKTAEAQKNEQVIPIKHT